MFIFNRKFSNEIDYMVVDGYNQNLLKYTDFQNNIELLNGLKIFYLLFRLKY